MRGNDGEDAASWDDDDDDDDDAKRWGAWWVWDRELSRSSRRKFWRRLPESKLGGDDGGIVRRRWRLQTTAPTTAWGLTIHACSVVTRTTRSRSHPSWWCRRHRPTRRYTFGTIRRRRSPRSGFDALQQQAPTLVRPLSCRGGGGGGTKHADGVRRRRSLLVGCLLACWWIAPVLLTVHGAGGLLDGCLACSPNFLLWL